MAVMPTAFLLAILIGATLVFFVFPKKQEELSLLDSYAKTDAAA